MKLSPSDIFSEKNQELCVEEILSTLKNDDLPQASFKVDFNLSKGRMTVEDDHNTVLSFDTKADTSLRSVLDYICDVEEVADEDIKIFDTFRYGIIKKLNNEESKDRIRDIIRDKIFKDTPEELVPIEILNVMDIEISDLPEVDYVLVVKKMAPPNYQGSSISDDLFKERYESGEDFNDIVKRKKESGDKRYKYVEGVEERKTFFEITIPIHADYSLKEIPLKSNDS
jgi:hypothetical protein